MTTPPPSPAGLARCVGDVQSFLRDHWGRAPLHRPGVGPAAFADLLSLADVDRLVSSSFARQPTFRLVRDGTPVPPARYTKSARVGGQTVSGVGNPAKVWEEFRTGATIVLQGTQRYWPPLADFCRALELELTHPVQANAYVTPAGAQGLAVHYDTHDVFVLQVAGSKHWEIHAPVLEDPLASQPWTPQRGTPGPVILSVDLQAGDCLYIPRGFLHAARAQRDLSAHLTIGIISQTAQDVLQEVVAATAIDTTFRRSLPPGFANESDDFVKAVDEVLDDFRRWLGQADARAVGETLVRRFWSTRSALLEGQLSQLQQLDAIDDATRLRRRPGSICHMVRESGQLVAVLGDRQLRMPGRLEPAMRRATTGHTFAVSDLADLLDAPSRMVLARRLVREGLLEIVAG